MTPHEQPAAEGEDGAVPAVLRLVGRAVPLVVRHTSRVALKLKVTGRPEGGAR